MDQLRNNAAHDGKEEQRHALAADDLSMLVEAFSTGDIPSGIATSFLIPFIAYTSVRLVRPLVCGVAKWLDYRRYLNGGDGDPCSKRSRAGLSVKDQSDGIDFRGDCRGVLGLVHRGRRRRTWPAVCRELRKRRKHGFA